MLKRFTRDELIEILNGIGYEELATSNTRWECTSKIEEGQHLFRMFLNDKLENLAVYRRRVIDYTTKSNEPGMSKDNATVYQQAAELIQKFQADEENACMEYSKKLYNKEKNLYTTHLYFEFPLDKHPLLNALYDDFSAAFLYFDNISCVQFNKCAWSDSLDSEPHALEAFAEKFLEKDEVQSFVKLTKEQRRAFLTERFGIDRVDYVESLPKEERIEYIKKSIEFDTLILGAANSSEFGILVYGTPEPTYSKFDENQQLLLPEYCDFNKVTLAQTLKIRNNDLLQMMQSKIDIDKEKLEIVDERNVRGDVYQIKKSPKPVTIRGDQYEYFIRYVCPSTGRVYHNLINERNLATSKFYKSGDPTTFIHSWWHINNGGDDPLENVDVIRC